jgi:hypothetical protein
VASNLSVGSGVIVIFSYWAHLAASAPFRAGPRGPVSGRLSTTTSWRAGPALVVSRRLSAAGISLLGHPIPAVELGPPHGRLTGHDGRTSTGLPRSAHTSYDRVGCPLYPGDDGAHPGPVALTGQRLPRSQRPVPVSRSSVPSIGTAHYEASTRVQAMHPSGLPLACRRPDGTDRGLGFSLSFGPRRPGAGRRTSGWGQAIEHGPQTTLYDISRTSNPACLLVVCDLASHGRLHKRAARAAARIQTSAFAESARADLSEGDADAAFGRWARPFR